MGLLTQDELVRLNPSERLALIPQFSDSIEDNQLPLAATRQVLVDRRLASLDEDGVRGFREPRPSQSLSSVVRR